jgi:uncharacterized protein YfaT (DUF1175 family)
MNLSPYDINHLRAWFCRIAQRYWYTLYHYGGKNKFTGVDCSQLVVNCLKAIGFLEEWEDLSSQDLWDKYSVKYPVTSTCPGTGALAFYFKGDEVEHIAICLDHLMTIQAAGGSRDTDTEKEAIKAEAWVKYKRVDKDPRPVRFVDIFAPEIECSKG